MTGHNQMRVENEKECLDQKYSQPCLILFNESNSLPSLMNIQTITYPTINDTQTTGKLFPVLNKIKTPYSVDHLIQVSSK